MTGRINQLEDPEKALKREIMEEVGIEIEIIKPISVYHIFRGKKIAKNELVGIMYWCETDTENVKISAEHTDFKWVEAKEALNMVPKPSLRADIEAFIREKTRE